MAHDPLTVACPDCQAPTGVPCRMAAAGGDTARPDHHATRTDAARLYAVEHGTCALCGSQMVRAVDPDDAWHPDPADAAACPVMPPVEDWPAYSTAVNLGLSPGHPGPEHFRPAERLTNAGKDQRIIGAMTDAIHSAEHGPESGRPQDFNHLNAALVEQGYGTPAEVDAALRRALSTPPVPGRVPTPRYADPMQPPPGSVQP